MTRLTLIALVLMAAAARAADPVVVELPGTAAVRTAVASVGDVARVSGGDPAVRDRVARLDLVEFKPRATDLTVSRRQVEYRVRLAGFDPAAVRVAGAEQTAVSVTRRTVTPEEVVAEARAELLRRLPGATTAELVQPIAARLPDVPADEPVVIAAKPHSRPTGAGRAQMDVTVSAAGEQLVSLAVLFEVKPTTVAGTSPVIPAPATEPRSPAEMLVRPRQRVTMLVRVGALNVSAVGEAQQGGRLGQVIPVANVDSKKVVSARVTGPGAVEVDLGGAP